jgi:hypothetical protein
MFLSNDQEESKKNKRICLTSERGHWILMLAHDWSAKTCCPNVKERPTPFHSETASWLPAEAFALFETQAAIDMSRRLTRQNARRVVFL